MHIGIKIRGLSLLGEFIVGGSTVQYDVPLCVCVCCAGSNRRAGSECGWRQRQSSRGGQLRNLCHQTHP